MLKTSFECRCKLEKSLLTSVSLSFERISSQNFIQSVKKSFVIVSNSFWKAVLVDLSSRRRFPKYLFLSSLHSCRYPLIHEHCRLDLFEREEYHVGIESKIRSGKSSFLRRRNLDRIPHESSVTVPVLRYCLAFVELRDIGCHESESFSGEGHWWMEDRIMRRNDELENSTDVSAFERWESTLQRENRPGGERGPGGQKFTNLLQTWS